MSMPSSNPRPLLTETVLSWLRCKLTENRVPLLSSLIFGFLAHTFAFTNKLPNSDDVLSLFSKGGSLSLGRWGLEILSYVFPDVSMPWVYGIITIGLLAVSVCLLVHTLQLRSKWIQGLAAGLVLTFPSLTGTFSYMFTSSSYGVAFLLAALAPWLLQKKSLWCRLVALPCMIFSLSIYQGYVSLTAGVLVLVLMRQLMDGEDFGTVFRRGLAYVGFLILSMGLYFGITQILLRLFHTEMGWYASRSIDFKPSELLYKVQLAYTVFFDHFQGKSIGLMPNAFSRGLHIALLAFACVLLLLRLIRMRRRPLCALLLAALTAIFPLAVNCIYLFILFWSIHTLVMYGFVSFYLLVLLLADSVLASPVRFRFAAFTRRLSLDAVSVLSALIVITNIYIANEAYLDQHLRYENAYAFYTSLIADIKANPDFTEGTKLAVIGKWGAPDFYRDNFDFSNSITGIDMFGPDTYSKEQFVQYYLGISIPFASEEELSATEASPEFAEMPVYPYYGSLRKIGNVIVVKLS